MFSCRAALQLLLGSLWEVLLWDCACRTSRVIGISSVLTSDTVSRWQVPVKPGELPTCVPVALRKHLTWVLFSSQPRWDAELVVMTRSSFITP